MNELKEKQIFEVKNDLRLRGVSIAQEQIQNQVLA